MLKDLAEFLATSEERIEFGGRALVVRELAAAADMVGFASVEGGEVKLSDDFNFLLITRCTFNEDGTPAFTTEDVPALKSASRKKLKPLLDAVNRVNGLDAETEVKNSAAARG